MHTSPPVSHRQLHEEPLNCDLVVVGGGLAGVCCAITAAREGVQVVLVQDRPVLGGNASSEVRLWVLGATSHMGNNNRWAREGGVIDEILWKISIAIQTTTRSCSTPSCWKNAFWRRASRCCSTPRCTKRSKATPAPSPEWAPSARRTRLSIGSAAATSPTPPAMGSWDSSPALHSAWERGAR